MRNQRPQTFIETLAGEIERRHHARDFMPTVQRRKGPERVPISVAPKVTLADLFPKADWDYIKRAVT